jgi:hypothetical protein
MISRIMMYCSLPVRLVLAPRAFNKIWTSLSSDKIMIKRLSPGIARGCRILPEAHVQLSATAARAHCRLGGRVSYYRLQLELELQKIQVEVEVTVTITAVTVSPLACSSGSG